MARLSRGGVPGDQRDERLGVGAAPAGDGIPAGRRPVAGDRRGRELHGVVSLGDVVEGLAVAGAAGDLVDGRVNEARWLPAYWSAKAISAAQIGALALVPPPLRIMFRPP